ncbi:alpha/beta hydrolase [Marivirga sp.]|uniref:alpha/beta fold hydrolase n=1 Tax=Marivirga sp. TaxID=2018662 RepID=UPI0025E534E7|nr:alpha/beta hydrolase [Marivirga sp.]
MNIKMMKNNSRVGISILLALILILCITPVNADKYTGTSKKKCKLHGAFLDGICVAVDNHLLFVKSYGQQPDKDHPVVIFLSGSGNTHYVWEKVAPSVAKFAHVVTYDRTGYGHSQQYTQPIPLTAAIVVNNLKQLLKKMNLPPPYILVAHSHGGIYAQYFALTNPQLLKGLVLVDSSTYQLLNWKRFKKYTPSEDVKNTEPFYYEALGITPSLKMVKLEMIKKADAPLGNMPLSILTAEDENELGYFTLAMMKDWRKFQKLLSKTSNKSTYVLVKDSGHFIQIDKPELVVKSIKELIK